MTADHHTAVEEALFRALNVDGGRLLDALAVALSARGFGVAAGAIVVAVIAIVAGRRRRGLLVGFAVALAMSDFLGARVLRPLFGRTRPCFALPAGSVRWLAPASDVGSLPSLHAANFFAMALVAWAADRRLGIAALAVAVAVSLSRVYVGVHWPTDVLAGAAWGAVCAFTALAVARRAVGPAPGAGEASGPRGEGE